ncbi:hypothetical protein [Desulfovibrio sp. MES5]|nr:hypothetical protein [Desulfovibrio sp. MES5]
MLEDSSDATPDPKKMIYFEGLNQWQELGIAPKLNLADLALPLTSLF